MTLQSVKGKCLCGAVEVTVAKASSDIGACHCGMCRKWSGGPLLAVDCGTEVSFSGGDNVSAFQASEWAQRGFCNQCGTHLFYKLLANGQYMMPAGLFEGTPAFNFDHQIFIEEKPSYYEFANQTTNLTGEQVFAQFAQK